MRAAERRKGRGSAGERDGVCINNRIYIRRKKILKSNKYFSMEVTGEMTNPWSQAASP